MKKYMVVDLALLLVIGCGIEVLGMYVFNLMINALIMSTAVSLLIMLVAVTRWGWKGLIIAPFLALATVLSGRYLNVHSNYRVNYDWRLYIAILFQLLSVGINILWFKKYKSEKTTFKSVGSTLALCAIDMIVSLIVLSLVYMICSLGKFIMLSLGVWNSFGYILLFIGAFILGQQGILINVKKNLEEQRIEREEEKNFMFNLTDENNFENEKGDSENGKDG